MRLLRLVIVGPDLGSEPDLLDLLMTLLLSRFLRSDGLLVLELPVVHDLADGRIRVGRHLDEIKPGRLRLSQRLFPRHDPDLRTVGSDQSDLRCPYPFVDPAIDRALNPSRLRYNASLPVSISTSRDE